jgi:hypothetical protein
MDKYRKVKIVGKGSFGYAVLVESKKSKRQIMRYPYVVTYRESFMEKMYTQSHSGASVSSWTTARAAICSTR